MKKAPKLIAWYLKSLGYRAITLPPFGIYALQDSIQDEALLRHELVHWEQYKRMGALRFYVTYIWLLMRHGYKNHPMEIEAKGEMK
jgi:hypothetical protein